MKIIYIALLTTFHLSLIAIEEENILKIDIDDRDISSFYNENPYKIYSINDTSLQAINSTINAFIWRASNSISSSLLPIEDNIKNYFGIHYFPILIEKITADKGYRRQYLAMMGQLFFQNENQLPAEQKKQALKILKEALQSKNTNNLEFQYYWLNIGLDELLLKNNVNTLTDSQIFHLIDKKLKSLENELNVKGTSINPNLLTNNTNQQPTTQTTQPQQTTQQAKAQEEQTTATTSEQQTPVWLIYALAALGLVLLLLVIKKLKNKA